MTLSIEGAVGSPQASALSLRDLEQVRCRRPLSLRSVSGRVWRMLGTVMAHTTIDRVRFTIEQMPPAEYLASSYYERWLWAIDHLAMEQGLLDSDDRPPAAARPSPTTPT
jgi:hypothetical protein